jgi:HlyD family secretion protein
MKGLTARGVLLLVAAAVCLLGGAAFWRRSPDRTSLVATVRRGSLTAQLTTTGILRPSQSITYRSPVAGREVEITELVPEGTRVSDGDLLVRLDTTELQREVERARQEVRQSQLDRQVAEIEREDAAAALQSVSEGEGALSVEEARTRLELADRKTKRLREEYQQLKPLIDKGVITREELQRTGDELEQSEEELALAKRRAGVLTDLSHPRDRQRAELQLAQKESQLENARTKVREADARLKSLVDLLESCSVYARRPGIVVYEDNLSTYPRRKIRAGDRVTSSQGLITIPEVNTMVMEASVGEAEVHRVRPGQPAAIRVEAFPAARLTGRVSRVGTLARSAIERPTEEKRFDVVIELDSTDIDLRPEMTARADITVGTRVDVLLLPVTAVFDEQGTLVAHVVGRDGVQRRPVDLGESNDQRVEVLAGVREGEQVMLVPPRASEMTSAGAAPARAIAPSTGGRGTANALQPR